MRTRLHRLRSYVLLSLAGLLLLIAARSDGQDRTHPGAVDGFIKVGRHHINANRITFTTDNGKTLIVYFGDGAHPGLHLTGSEAAGLRQWLDGHALEPVAQPHRRKPLMEGVDINDNVGSRDGRRYPRLDGVDNIDYPGSLDRPAPGPDLGRPYRRKPLMEGVDILDNVGSRDPRRRSLMGEMDSIDDFGRRYRPAPALDPRP